MNVKSKKTNATDPKAESNPIIKPRPLGVGDDVAMTAMTTEDDAAERDDA